MKKVILLSLMICAGTTIVAQEELTVVPQPITVSSLGLVGNVESIYTIEYGMTLQDRIMDDTTRWVDTVLHKQQDATAYFNKEGFLTRKESVVYNDKGKPDQTVLERHYYTDNKLTAITNYIDGKMQDSIAFVYDRRNTLDYKIYYDRKGNVTSRVEYFYRNDRIFNIKIRNEDRRLRNFIRYEYYSNGILREKEVKGETMQYLYSLKYEYDTLDDNNIQVNKYEYVGEYKCKTMEGCVYTPAGMMLEKTITDSTKHVIDYRTLRYNEKGLLETELVFANETKQDNSYYYSYNDKGYWNTKKIFDNGIPVRKVHRAIEYYKEDEEQM